MLGSQRLHLLGLFRPQRPPLLLRVAARAGLEAPHLLAVGLLLPPPLLPLPREGLLRRSDSLPQGRRQRRLLGRRRFRRLPVRGDFGLDCPELLAVLGHRFL